MDFLEKKYKYDKKWLFQTKNFDIEQAKEIVIQIKNILQEQSTKVHLYDLKERVPQMIEDIKKKHPKDCCDKHIKELLPMLELHQYVELFFDYMPDKAGFNMDEIREEGWKSFYNGLIELFVIRKSDFDSSLNMDSFFNNFSISFEENLNSQFQTIGNYNIINSHPIIKLDEKRYFVPNPFLISESVYESPFYWMWLDDKSYRNQISENRGKVGEEIVYEFLLKIFGINKTFKAVKVKSPETNKSTKKERDATDIDVLCLLGSKAICVQVKSKKLTELSRIGNDEQLQKDFRGAVQDAYEQGLVSRQKILEKNAKFIDESGNVIKLSEEIDEVYLEERLVGMNNALAEVG